MEIKTNKENGALKVALKGRLDTVGAGELIAILPLPEREGFDIILDFSDLQYISSAGLRVLVSFKKDAETSKKTLKIINANAIVKEIFRATGFDKFLNLQ